MTRLALTLAVLLAAAPAAASDYPERAVLGGAFGGAAGALLGGHIDGPGGAILGGALGAAAGSAIAIDRHHRHRAHRGHGYYVTGPRDLHGYRHEYRPRRFEGYGARFGDARFRQRLRYRDHDLRFRLRYD